MGGGRGGPRGAVRPRRLPVGRVAAFAMLAVVRGGHTAELEEARAEGRTRRQAVQGGGHYAHRLPQWPLPDGLQVVVNSVVKPGMARADNMRIFRTNLLLPSISRNSRSGLKSSTIHPDLPPAWFLLFLPGLGSSKYVPNLRKNDVIDACCQYTASLVKRWESIFSAMIYIMIWFSGSFPTQTGQDHEIGHHCNVHFCFWSHFYQ